MRKYLALALLATACKVEGGDIAPLKAGDGITVGDKNAIAVDQAKVPVVTDCASGFLRREGDAWKCVALEQKDVKDLESTLAGKLGKDEAGAIYLTKDDAAGKYLTPEAADAKFTTQEAADAKYETKEAAQAFALATDLSALEAKVYLKTEADGLFATKASLGDYYTKAESDARFAAKNHTHALGDLNGVAPLADFNALSTKVNGLTMSAFQSNVPTGSCISVQHNWNTRAVGYSAWYSDPAAPAGTMIPALPGHDFGTPNLALGKAYQASSTYSDSSPANAADGNSTTLWTSALGQQTGYWQLDLGALTPVAEVKVQTSSPTAGPNSAAVTAWDVFTAGDDQVFTKRGSQTCTFPGSCTDAISLTLPAGLVARYVKVVPTQSRPDNAGTYVLYLAEVQVYAGTNTISMPDENTIKFCNYTGIARDLSLAVWH